MTYASEVLADSPLLYWRLGDASGTTAADASGNGRAGTYNGSPTLGTAGLLTGDADTAVTFDGVNDYVSSSNSTELTAYTVEAWIKAGAGNAGYIVNRWGSASSNQILLLELQSTLLSTSIRTSGGLFSASVARPTDGVAHHVAATYSGGTLRLYLDGSEVASNATVTGTMTTSSIGFAVGARSVTPNFFFTGVIDEVAYYSTALSGTRIAAHHAAGSSAGTNEVNLAATIPSVAGGLALTATRTVSIAADMPSIQGDVHLDGDDAPASMNLDVTMPSIVGGFTLDNSDAAAVRFAAAMPSIVGDLQVQALVADSQVNRAGGWVRNNSAEAVWTPPVIPPAAAILPQQQVVAQAYTAPTIDGTHAIINPTFFRAPKHRERIVIAGREMSYFRDAPTPPAEYQLVQPFLWGAATVTLPQIVLPFEQPGYGGLAWLKKGATVLIQRVDTDTNEVVATDYRGIILAFDTSGPLRVECGGWLTGKASLQDRQMRLIQSRRDAGGLVASALRSLRGVVHGPVLGATTGIELIDWGGGGLLDYLNELVGKMTTVGGDKWTVMPDDDGIFHTTIRDVDTIHGTVYFNDARVKFDGRSDLAETPNRIYASGVTPDGMVVKFGAYPGLIQGAAAPYPMDDNSAFGVGTTDGDTDTGDGISIMGIRLRVTGYLDARPFYSTYDTDMAEGIKDLQRDARLTVTGIMNPNTWRALWDLSTTGYDLRGIEILPAAEDTAVKPFRRSASGAIIARNPNYDATVNPVDRTIAMGYGLTKTQIRQNARNLLAGGEVWRGTIEITTGAIVAGEHTPGDPITDILYDRDIKPGMNLWAPLFAGGIVLHVAGASVSSDGQSVTLVVSTIPDDTIPTWAAIQRDRDNRNTIHRSFFAQRRSSSFERENTIDEVGGTISPVQLDPDNWTVFPVVAKQAGTIEKIRLRLSPSREFVVAAFGRQISPGRLRRVTNAPLTLAGRKRWTEENVYDALNRDHVVLYVAGSDEDPAGYSPGRKTDDGSLTGRWEDEAGFPFVTFGNATDRGSVIWVAVWVGASATVSGGRIMWPSAEEY